MVQTKKGLPGHSVIFVLSFFVIIIAIMSKVKSSHLRPVFLYEYQNKLSANAAAIKINQSYDRKVTSARTV
jgi:Na+-transporting methylmalonyl-CoA/oxaloacetate decarboxylase gamma subunit